MFKKKETPIIPKVYVELRQCKLCGELYYYPSSCMSHLVLRTHNCENGDMGNSEFIGYVLSENIDENLKIEI